MQPLSKEQVKAYQQDGVVCLPGVFSAWVDTLAEGVEYNLDNPGPYAADNLKPGESGRFFDDYCNWQQIPAFVRFVRESPIASLAAQLMQSSTVQVFHDHVLIKEPGTVKPTPWHQDAPYYFVDGEQLISFWIPLDPVDEATLRLVPGSHRWDKPVLPTRWLNEDDFYAGQDDYLPVPDPDADGMAVLEWAMQPGDAVAFHYRTLHGARGNLSERRRRAFSLRLVGDDARYVERPGRTSPPFPGHSMKPGEKLRQDWFPVVYER